MNVAIIKYNAGNIFSVDYALKRIGVTPIITSDKETLLKADKIIFPGVGEAETTMKYLKEQNLDKLIKDLKQPLLGICLGMQLLSAWSEEGATDCLDLVQLKIRLFERGRGYKIPHMGWNTIDFSPSNPLFKGIANGSYFYFVHSYYAERSPYSIACTSYDDILFSSAIAKDNFYGVQFHPEKSGDDGLKLLSNFLEM